MKKSVVIIFLFFTSASFAQLYEVKSVEFPADPDIAAYFEDEKSVKYTEEMKSQAEPVFKSAIYKIEKKSEDTLILYSKTPYRDSKSFLLRSSPNVYEEYSNNSFTRAILGNEPKLIFGRLKPLGDPIEGKEKEYSKLEKKYGDKIEVLVLTSNLIEVDPDYAIDTKKQFMVKDVTLKINEDVVEFAKKYNKPMPTGFKKSSENVVKEMYDSVLYSFDVMYKFINIYQHSKNANMSFESNLKKISENKYQAQIMKSLWIFHEQPDTEESFDLHKLEYITYFELTDEDKDKPEYEKLKAKYGTELPYNIIVQELEEVAGK